MWAAAFGPSCWERAAGQVVQAVLTVAVLLLLPSPVRSFVPLVGAGLVAAAAGGVLLDRMRPGAGGSRWARLRHAVADDVRDGLLARRALPVVVAASAVVVAGHALTFLIAARTAGADAPVSRILPLALLAMLAMVLPSVAVGSGAATQLLPARGARRTARSGGHVRPRGGRIRSSHLQHTHCA